MSVQAALKDVVVVKDAVVEAEDGLPEDAGEEVAPLDEADVVRLEQATTIKKRGRK